jgi:hypothetical protein
MVKNTTFTNLDHSEHAEHISCDPKTKKLIKFQLGKPIAEVTENKDWFFFFGFV